MKRGYYNILAIPALAVIICCLFSGFASKNPLNVTEFLIDQRSAILQSTLNGDLPYETAEKELRRIERESLLEEDLQALRSGKGDTMNHAYSAKIKKMKQKKQMFQYITYEASILWDNGEQAAEERYHIVIKEESGEFFLTIFEPA